MKFHRNSAHPAALAALAALCLTATTNAQFVREYTPWPVIVGGQQLVLPYLGGINSPKPALEDFDGDGLVDLLYGDGRGKITYLRNTGTAQIPNWTPAADRLGGLNTGSWFTLCDIDDDGDLDLFCDALNAMTAFYRNVTVGDNIQFELVDNLYGGFTTGFNNTSDFADIDGDGDFDFFFGNASGGLDFYRNTGNAANANFVFITAFYDSVLAYPGGGGLIKPLEPTPHDGPQLSPGLAAHGFSAVQFADLDSDGDLDLFYGDIFNTSAYFFENRGDSLVSDLNLLTENYLPFNNQAFNHTTFGDVDGDGDPDMIVGAANAQTIDNLIFGRNEGEPGVFLEDYFLIEDFNIIKNIDIGGNGHPAFGDIDADGDQDMLLGGVNGRIALFQNIGTAVAPAFQLVSTTFAGINVGSAATPELVDWDNDNDFDLLVGTGAGYVQLWQNTGTPQAMTLSLVGNLSDTTKVIKVDQWV
ncbi:MAG TPA: VCBS repeat-containing protein, partial [candidate division Zixibacteria bacterium]|nr:VCBS repeat-containing protein [candidate division Zixibacteria bacterium]